MAKKVSIIVRTAPHGSATAGEAFRAAQGIVSMEHEVDVIFAEDGVFVPCIGQNPENIGLSDVSSAFASLEELGARLNISEQCAQVRHLKQSDFAYGKLVSIDAISSIIAQSDKILNFT